MTYDPIRHHRRALRLQHYDYSWPAWYYVTICTSDRLCVLGKIVSDQMVLSQWGNLAQQQWVWLPKHFPTVELDAHVVMPNHIHGIIIINNPRRGEITSPLQNDPNMRGKPSLGKTVAFYKYQTTKMINEMKASPGARFWQRNYYEHIIRNENDLHRLRPYVVNNPLQWQIDEESPYNSLKRT